MFSLQRYCRSINMRSFIVGYWSILNMKFVSPCHVDPCKRLETDVVHNVDRGPLLNTWSSQAPSFADWRSCSGDLLIEVEAKAIAGRLM